MRLTVKHYGFLANVQLFNISDYPRRSIKYVKLIYKCEFVCTPFPHYFLSLICSEPNTHITGNKNL